MRSREAAECDWASQLHLLDTAFVAGTMGKKAAWQQTNPSHNISKMCGAGAGHDARLKTIGPVRAETPFTVVVARPQGSVAKFGR